MCRESPELRKEILSYLRRHPDAADTLDGVVQWWLPRQRYVEARELIEDALESMVKDGVVLKVFLPGGTVVYRFGSTGIPARES